MTEALNSSGKEEVVSPSETREELSSQKAWTLLFNSFNFSQGSAGVQDLIWQWLHSRYPKLSLSGKVEQELLTTAEKDGSKYLSGGITHPGGYGDSLIEFNMGIARIKSI